MKTWQKWAVVAVVIGALAAVTFLAWQTGNAKTQAAQAVSAVLQNPGFDGDFYLFDGIGELGMADGWAPWFVEAPGIHRPEYKPELPDSRICNGSPCGRVYGLTGKAQKQFVTFAKIDGGIRQNVKVEPGKWYRFTARFYNWTSSENNSDASGGSTGGCSGLVGINPWGDWNATYRTTIWGKESYHVYDQWVEVEVIAQAWSDEISLFTRGTCQWPVKHNDFYWDDTSFSLASVDVPNTPIPPTATPEPTLIPPTPTATPEPGQSTCPTIEEIDEVIRGALRDLELVYP